MTVQVEADANAVTDADCTCDEEDGDCPCCETLAKLWLNKVTRKVCKSLQHQRLQFNAYGFTDQIIQDGMEKLNRRVRPGGRNDGASVCVRRHRRGQGCQILAQIIHDMVRANLSAAMTRTSSVCT